MTLLRQLKRSQWANHWARPIGSARGDLMDRQQAREFMVQLINRDREAEKLQPFATLDKVASDAGAGTYR